MVFLKEPRLLALENVVIWAKQIHLDAEHYATPRGIEIISDPTAMRAVPESKGQIPKLGLRPLGTQSVPEMNSKKVASSYSKKRIVPDASVYMINALAITDNEVTENNALWVNRLRGARPSRKVPDSIMIYHFIVHANVCTLE